MAVGRYLRVSSVESLHLCPEVHFLDLLEQTLFHTFSADLYTFSTGRQLWRTLFLVEAKEISLRCLRAVDGLSSFNIIIRIVRRR